MSTIKCSDKHCPTHNGFKTHGRIIEGTIIKMDTHGSVTIELPRLFYLPKFERYEKRRSRIRAHKPFCMDAKIGNKVKITESRPISKTKHFVITEILK